MSGPDDRELAIRTIAAETSGDPRETLAIAATIRNRVNTGRWGTTPGDVVLASNQFEPWNTPGGRNDPMRIDPNSPRYQLAAEAWDSLSSGKAEDPTGGRTHFFAPGAQAALGRNAPAWSRAEPGVRIGQTAFYAPEGRAPQARPASMQIQWDDETPQQPAQGGLPSGVTAFAPVGEAPPMPPQRPQALGGNPAPQPDLAAAIKWDDAPAKPSPFGTVPDQVAQQSGSLPELTAAMEARKPGMAESFGRGAIAGVTMNTGDEIAAANMAGAAGIPAAPKDATLGQKLLDPGQHARTIATMTPIPGMARMALERLAPSIFGSQATDEYKRVLQQERDANAAAQYENPGSYIGGNVVGGFAVPMGGAAAAGVKGGMVAGARMGLIGGALSGAGEGETPEERAKKALIGGTIGTVAGGALGSVAGKLAGNGAQVLPAPNAVVQAGENLGVTIPRAVATDNTAVQRAGQVLRNVPFSGDKIVKATQGTVEQLGTVADNISGTLGSGDIVNAGIAAGGGIRNWITGKSSAAVKTAYDAVDNAVNPNVATPLASTQAKVSEILAQRQSSRISDPGTAVKFVIDAVQDPQGLTYQGIKGLRTRVGEMLDNPSLMPAGTSQAELRQIYGSLTNDLQASVANSGGPQAEKLWQRANSLNKAVMDRRAELSKIVGKDGGASDEQVFGRIQQLAAGGTKGDIDLLLKARRAMSSSEWDEVGSGIVANMGRDPSGNFTPDRFVTAWGKLSDNGKQALFQPAHRQALEDIQTISQRLQKVGKMFGNPSGTAQNVAGASIGAGLIADPITTMATVIGGGITARVLANPASTASFSRWSRAYEMAVTKPSSATVSGLQVASRNFASTIGEKLGVQTSAQEILQAVHNGASAGRAEDKPQNP